MSEIDKDWRIADLQAKLSTSKQSNCDLEDMLVALKEENEEEVTALERQLAEAREAFKQIKELTYNDFDHDVLRVHGIACKQLKEQG